MRDERLNRARYGLNAPIARYSSAFADIARDALRGFGRAQPILPRYCG
jgi:hypothetical protein